MSCQQKAGQNHNKRTDKKNLLKMWQSSNIWKWH